MTRYVDLTTAKYVRRTIDANHLVVAAHRNLPRPANTLTDAELLDMFGLGHIDIDGYYAGLKEAA